MESHQPPSSEAAPTTLLSLPDEILSQIITHVNKPAALALALVSPRFPSLVDPILWRHLALCIQTPGHYKAAPRSGLEIAAAKKEDEAIKRNFEAKVKAVLSRADARRAGWVQSYSMTLQPSVTGDLVRLLRRVLPRLRSLTVKAPVRYGIPYRARDTFDRQISTAGLLFPALRRLKLECYSFRFQKFIHYLTSSRAPNLETLDIDVHQVDGNVADDDHEHYPGNSQLPPHPTLRNVRLFRYRTSMSHEDSLISMFRPLMYAPNVRRVFLQYGLPDPPPSSSESDVEERIPWWKMNPHARKLLSNVPEQVEDLAAAWDVDPREFAVCTEPDKPRFGKLRRLVVGWYDVEGSLDYLPKLPSLEIIAISPPHYWASAAPDYNMNPKPRRARKMSPEFASSLRGSPHLRIIHEFDPDARSASLAIFEQLDEVELGGTAKGYITSVRHGEDELLHARIMLDPSNGWLDMTNYKGRTIPLGVIEAMRLREGMEIENWKGRGLEVGDEAWEVLEKWYKKNKSDQRGPPK